MSVYHIEKLTTVEIDVLSRGRLAAVLPLGSIEAHGPHLPVCTDTVISSKLAELAAGKLSRRGLEVVILPPLQFSPSSFARRFKGTLNVNGEVFCALLKETCSWAAGMGIPYLLISNCHFDPANTGALRDIAMKIDTPRVVFPDFTKRRLAERLTDEFRRGSCHAGRFETSLMLAAQPELVSSVYKQLKANEVNLAAKIREGADDFMKIGMDSAYCGDPAAATAEEGAKTYEILSDIMVEVFMDVYEAER